MPGIERRRFRPYPEYKASGLEWLGKIPAHWMLDRLRSTITNCQNGIWGDDPDGVNDIPCIRVADFDRLTFRVDMDALTLRKISLKDAVTRIVCQGDLLLEKSGGGDKQPVGAVVQYDHDVAAVCSNFIARMSVAGGFSARFLSYLHAALYAARINVRSIKQNTGIQNLDSSSYLREVVAFPIIGEQRIIAAFLDRETAKIDALLEKKERLIELLQEKRTALITKAVTKGLDPNAPMKNSGVEWLGKIPAHWEIKKLNWLFYYEKGPNAAVMTKEYIGGNPGEFPVYSGQTENDGLMGLIDTYTFDFSMSVVLVTTVGARAMTTRLINGKFNLSQNCALIIPRNENLDVRYYEGILNPLFNYERSSISLIMQPSLRFEDLDRFKVPLPPSDEQRTIGDLIDHEAAKIDALISRIREAITSLREYRTALISAAVTGKIDVRDAPSSP